MIIDFLILGKLIGAGLATISLAGAGVGIGVIFAGFLNALARNPKDEKKLLTFNFNLNPFSDDLAPNYIQLVYCLLKCFVN